MANAVMLRLGHTASSRQPYLQTAEAENRLRKTKIKENVDLPKIDMVDTVARMKLSITKTKRCAIYDEKIRELF